MAKQSRMSQGLTASVIVSSAIEYDLYCELCSEDGKHLEAEGYCVDCQDYLCGECVKGHRRTRISRNHVLQDTKQMPQQKPLPSVIMSSTGACTEKCAHHPDRLVEYYCREDRSLGCSVCMTLNHRLCTGVDHIPNTAYQLLDSQEYKQFTNTLNSLKTKSDSVIKSSQENVMIAEKRFNNAEHMLQELREKMNEAFDKFEEDLKNKANTMKSADLKRLLDIPEKVHAIVDEVQKISDELLDLQNRNNLAQLFINMIHLKDKADTLHSRLAEADTDNSVTDYTLEPDSQILVILDDPTSIGTLSVQASVMPISSPSSTLPSLKTTDKHAPAAQSSATVESIANDPSTMFGVQSSIFPGQDALTAPMPRGPREPHVWQACPPGWTSGPTPGQHAVRLIHWPITGEWTAQPRGSMGMPQNTMPVRPQQPQAPNMQQGARPGIKYPNQMPQSQAIVVPGQDALTASMLPAVPPQEQKQMLGERLFPLIQRMHPELAGKLTGMLLEIDNSELLHMLESTESLRAKVQEAVTVLQTHQA